jgi:hypothetical protein
MPRSRIRKSRKTSGRRIRKSRKTSGRRIRKSRKTSGRRIRKSRKTSGRRIRKQKQTSKSKRKYRAGREIPKERIHEEIRKRLLGNWVRNWRNRHTPPQNFAAMGLPQLAGLPQLPPRPREEHHLTKTLNQIKKALYQEEKNNYIEALLAYFNISPEHMGFQARREDSLQDKFNRMAHLYGLPLADLLDQLDELDLRDALTGFIEISGRKNLQILEEFLSTAKNRFRNQLRREDSDKLDKLIERIKQIKWKPTKSAGSIRPTFKAGEGGV